MFDRPTPFRLDPRALSEAFDGVAADVLARAAGRASEPVAGAGSPDALARLVAGGVPAAGRPLGEVADELRDVVLAARARTDHPRFFAFVPSPVSPVAWLADALTSVHNPHLGARRQAEGPAAVERALIRWLAQALGLPEGAGGLFVSGGSMANLAAVVAARDAKLTPATRGDGVAYVSAESHVSVARALRIAGLLDRQIRVTPVDAALRMDARALAAQIAADRAADLTPFLLVATAGSTNVGAVDPLPQLAEIAARENLWLHVDGAYGASIALSPAKRGLLAGIEHADSVAWDAHKWLFQTYGTGMLLARDPARLSASFGIEAAYLDDAGSDGPDFWDLGPELTRPARALKLWLTLQVMGLDAVGAAIEHGFRLAEAAERAVRATPGWEVATPAQLGVVTFRYAPEALPQKAAEGAMRRAAARLFDEGFAAVGATRVAGRPALRICALHPEATEADMAETIRRLDAHAQEISGL
ncbi:glutamate/tyrosine decarboxylase-like PLP-dependent enzyme [Methylopila capsulata]|uniref:Glutamate/tyrosine decarboxylase-like PLP-dependent enzyme n=1 Tax=Methylopila capsulata TaxID=61654 RepID=A0A9W6IQ29_9HYPH|nr:aminotransferase class V-fold PLP-dependent enzyme [Methylopila capsulata]MBM7851380.1 glutamate/tyrosine decarboxylase-like PLP-dependent enzyme [Methylopila capsulata]GLK54437.1 L-2,4-diaminobutyrate decarboxylase [Methylopila capsulata]